MEVILDNGYPLARGLAVTAGAAAATLLLSTLLGLLIAGVRMTKAARISQAFVEIFQNTPYPILVFIIFYGLPEIGVTLDAIQSTIVGIGLYSAAYISESLRSGVSAVAPGNQEAARSTGLGEFDTLRFVVAPQAIVYSLPPLIIQWCRCLRNISVMAIIGGQDILFEATQLASQTFHVLAFYFVAGIAYLVLSLPITLGTRWVQSMISWHEGTPVRFGDVRVSAVGG